jgi:Fur family ferric uptake transcriptional regulator
MEPATLILRDAGMRRTGPRQAVLEHLLASEHALSHQELENRLEGRVDRVTIYRILAAFEEHGIVHRIMDSQGHPQYAVCSSSCSGHHHHDEHIHFECNRCGNTYCLDEAVFPQVAMPQGFILQTLEIHARGCCPRCAAA